MFNIVKESDIEVVYKDKNGKIIDWNEPKIKDIIHKAVVDVINDMIETQNSLN